MKKDNIIIANIVVFLSVTALHFIRIVTGVDFYFGEVNLSIWVSLFGFVVALTLSILNWRILDNHGKKSILKIFLGLLIIDALIALYSWAEGLTYWGLTSAMLLWIFVIELVLVLLIVKFLRK